MKELGALLGGPLFQRLGWALLAFLWQGALIAALLACADAALGRAKARARYAAGCVALLLMLALPVATFLARRTENPGSSRALAGETAARRTAESPASGVSADPAGRPRFSAANLVSSVRRGALPATPFLVAGWILGVLLLSLRFLAGWSAARSLVRREVFPVSGALQTALSRLREGLRVSRPVRLMQSAALAVPTALGALRPVILLPVCAAAGLCPEAVEALLAHELAHIRRHDYLVNLLQTAVETLLFYHPAVWWVSRRIREERENCCDDLAVMATGDPRAYARALVGLEELRGLAAGDPDRPLGRPIPLAVAADGGSLWQRIARLLPVSTPPAHRASAWLAGLLALATLGVLGAAATISSSSFAAASEKTPSPVQPPRAQQDFKPAPSAAAATLAGRAEAARPAGQASSASGTPIAGGVGGGVPGGVASGVSGGISGGIAGGAASGAPEDPAGDAARAALSPGDLASLRSHGVTPEFLREIAALGYKRASVGDLVALRIHGVTPDYISRMTALVGRQSLEGLVSLRIHGVTPEFVERFHAAGYPQVSADTLLSLRIHGVDPDTAGDWEKLGDRKPGLDALVSARIHGATPEFARAMKTLGLEADLDTLVSLRIHGVTPEFVGAFQALGYKNLSADEAVSCRIHGVTPEFVKEIVSLGYPSPSLDELTALRIHGATPEFIRKANSSAGARLSIDELVEWRIHRRDPR